MILSDSESNHADKSLNDSGNSVTFNPFSHVSLSTVKLSLSAVSKSTVKLGTESAIALTAASYNRLTSSPRFSLSVLIASSCFCSAPDSSRLSVSISRLTDSLKIAIWARLPSAAAKRGW